MNSANVDNSASWTAATISGNSASTNYISTSTGKFAVTLSGDLIPPAGDGGEEGNVATDFSIKANFEGEFSIEPPTAIIAAGNSETFTAKTSDGTALSNVSWTIKNSTGVQQTGSADTFNTGSQLSPGEYDVSATIAEETASASLHIVGVKSLSVTCGNNSIASETATPGDAETLYIPKGSGNVTITAAPEPGSTWPAGYPTWTLNGTSSGTAGSANYSLSTATAGEYTIKASCGSSSKKIKIVYFSLEPLYYRIGTTGNFVPMEDYNGDGIYDLVIPYYNQIISVGDELNAQAKNNVDIFLKATLQPSANLWPEGKPTWSGATIVTQGDQSTAKLTVNNNGSSTVEVKYDDSYKVIAKIHVVKVSYEKDTNNKYGFDKPYAKHPQNDYNTYISLKNNDSTSVKVKLDPFPNGLDFYAKSNNSSRLKVGSADETKLNSSTSTVVLSGQSAGDANIFVYLKHNANSNKNVSLQHALYAKLYVEKSIDNWNIYRIKNSASSSNIAKKMTSSKMKTYANNIVKQAVCVFNNITVSSQIIINYDINSNGALDYYYDGGHQPELSLIQQASTLNSGDPKIAIVKEINAAWRTKTSASVNDTSLTLIGSAYIGSWLKQSYTLGDGGNAETITITGISGNTISFSPALTKTHAAGSVLYNHRLNGVSTNPQIVEDNNVEETCLHETLHRVNVANLLDINGREENIMNWYVTGTATTLRQRKQQLKYSSNQENQWDKVPR